jgi:hypothetical protein
LITRLDSLVVDQRVDGDGSSLIVGFVSLSPEVRPGRLNERLEKHGIETVGGMLASTLLYE